MMVRRIRNSMIPAGIALAVSALARDTRYASLAEIHSHPQSQSATATVQATLTLNGNPSYIQDSTGGAEVDGLFTQGLRIGDELLVTGYPRERETGLVFT